MVKCTRIESGDYLRFNYIYKIMNKEGFLSLANQYSALLMAKREIEDEILELEKKINIYLNNC
jgi:hypothetical protein